MAYDGGMAEKRSVEEVAAIVESEGLGYAVQDYMGADSIADPKLAKLWGEARDRLKAIEDHLEAEGSLNAVDEAPFSETVTVDHARLLVDDVPKDLLEAPRDSHDVPTTRVTEGGEIRVIEQGGRFGDTPEVLLEGTFSRAWLDGLMKILEGKTAWHISQAIRCQDGTTFCFTKREAPADE